MKRCTSCEKNLPLVKFERWIERNKFDPDNPRHRRPVCTLCRHPNAKEKAIERNNKARRGISKEEYETMLLAQDNACMICLCQSEDYWRTSRRDLAVDHDHETGEIRELLCQRCNIGLGHFSDNIDLLQRAIRYLERHGKTTTT